MASAKKSKVNPGKRRIAPPLPPSKGGGSRGKSSRASPSVQPSAIVNVNLSIKSKTLKQSHDLLYELMTALISLDIAHQVTPNKMREVSGNYERVFKKVFKYCMDVGS